VPDSVLLAQSASSAAEATAAPAAEASSDFERTFELVVTMFSKVDALAQPEHMTQLLQAVPVVFAVVCLISGVVCMLHGAKFYKPVVVIAALAIGAFVGYELGKSIEARYVVATVLAALLAVLAMPLMKYAVAVLGGLVGAFAGANAWSALWQWAHSAPIGSTPEDGSHWIGALLGLLVCGMLAFVLFEQAVIVFTSLSGATLAMIGATALLLQVAAWRTPILEQLSANTIVVPLLVLAPAVIGLIHQETSRKPAVAK